MSILNIKRGDVPKTAVAIEKAKERHMNGKGWPMHQRTAALNKAIGSTATPARNTKAMDAMTGLDINLPAIEKYRTDVDDMVNINTFNAQLAAYRPALARLNQYVLSEGRAEVWEDQPTGEVDEAGEPITEPVLVQALIPPLEPTIDVVTVAEDGTETTETVPNPLIVADAAERAAAQSVVSTTPDEVKGWE